MFLVVIYHIYQLINSFCCFFDQNGKNHVEKNSNHDHEKKHCSWKNSTNSSTGPVIDLTSTEEQSESVDEQYRWKNREDADIGDCSDVADLLFSTDFQPKSYNASDIPLKVLLLFIYFFFLKQRK